jgi:uncharacterized membrane protein
VEKHTAESGAPAKSTVFIEKNRLEFLFDGIFAIAMTILVLELKVPDLTDRHSVSELFHGLLEHGSTFVSYILSFVMLGMMWFTHNEQFQHVRKVSRSMLVLQLSQLAIAAFFPFCASLLGKYPTNNLSIVIYTGCIVCYMWGAAIHWIVAHRAGAFERELTREKYLMVRKRNLRSAFVISVLFLTYAVRAFGF